MIRFDDVSFTYTGADAPALCGVDLTVAPGEIVALVGANGSGKSTLARLCDGILVPTTGTVTVDGADTRDEARIWDIRSHVGLVLQNPDDQIVGTIVEEDVAFGPENLGMPRDEIRRRVDEALATVGLAGLEHREPHLLSEGQKQRLAIAGALALDPEYLVLDEPVAMLDPAGREAVVRVLERLARHQRRGVLHVTHSAEDAARCDRVVALLEGGIAFTGQPVELFADGRLTERIGLAPPPLAALAARLRTLGVHVPRDARTPEAVVEAL